LSLSFKAPHKPHNFVESETETYYEGMTFSKMASWGAKGLDLLPLQPKLSRQYAQRNGWIDEKAYQRHLRVYYQLISGIDIAIGMVLKELERQGVADNTVVIYTSDNGYFCGAHGLQGKVLPYDDASLIPLIIRYPRTGVRNRTSRAVVGNIDFAPTMLDYAGLPVAKRMDGISIRPVVNESKTRVRDAMLLVQNWGWINNDHSRGLAVATEQHKYIHWCYADQNVPPSEELFDTDKDPDELNNLADDPEAGIILAKMQAFYDQFHRHWSEYCVDSEDYTRHRQIFSRHVPWQEKQFRDSTRKGAVNMENIYQELTGKSSGERE
jgi:arylsulfatase A-like enzyme